MPEQTTFFQQQVGDKRIVVIKTYDSGLAHEALDQMSPEALNILAASLELESKFDPSDIPSASGDEFADFLWEVLQEGAREDWKHFSYFIAAGEDASGLHPLYVSPDWPSAEAFAKRTLALVGDE